MPDPNQLRDEYAGIALASLLIISTHPDSGGGTDPAGDSVAASAACCGWGADSRTVDSDGRMLSYADLLAGESFVLAGAMMKERARAAAMGADTIATTKPARNAIDKAARVTGPIIFERTMPFGRHKGERLSAIPIDYLGTIRHSHSHLVGKHAGLAVAIKRTLADDATRERLRQLDWSNGQGSTP